MKSTYFLSYLILVAIIFCNTTFSQNKGVHVNSVTQDITDRIPILKDQNDSLNYVYGFTNGNGIRSHYIKADDTDKQIIALMNAIDKAYKSIDKGEMYKLGLQIGNSLKQQKAIGLMGDPKLVFSEEWLRKGLVDALHGSYTLMRPKEAEQFVQESMIKFKSGSLPVGDEIIIRKLNYAYGMTNGASIKNNYIKGDSAAIEIASFLSGIEEGMKETVINTSNELVELGSKIGISLKEHEKSGLMSDPTLKVDIDLIKQGVVNGLRGSKIILTPEKAQIYLQTTMKVRLAKKTERLYGANRAADEKFLAENAKKPGVITTASGLQYEIIEKGFGKYPSENDKVKVNYHGTLLDGTVFDSSVDRKEPIVFKVNQVIKGWTEALQLMPVGSKFKVYIPQELAYESREQGKIKPFSMLIFVIELLSIEE
jgi:FKBP-type peptidyl-prolyl cis-trans isomerase FklB